MNKISALILAFVMFGCEPAFAKSSHADKNADGTISVTTTFEPIEQESQVKALKDRNDILNLRIRAFEEDIQRLQSLRDSEAIELQENTQLIADFEAAQQQP